jgi:hypothetical protein
MNTVVCLAGCAVVVCQLLVLAGNWQFFCCGGKFLLRPEKKVPVVCLAGAQSLLRPEKKRYSRLSVGCAVLAITTGKKRYSPLSGGLCCCIVSVFGSGGEIGSFFVAAGNFYYDRNKKKIQSSVWRVRDHYYDRKKKDTVVSFWFWREIGSFFVVAGNFAGNFYYDRKKKDTVVCLAGTRSLLRPEIKKDTVISFWFWREIGSFFVVFLLRPEEKNTVVFLAGMQ